MHKLIFLDIDWVLKTDLNPWSEFNQSCCNNLIYILNKTWAKLVISSSWRHNLENLKNAFFENWLDWNMYVVWVTPSKTWQWRDWEIFQWLSWNQSVYWEIKWIAIDDEYYDMFKVKFLGQLLKTEFDTWLNRELAEKAIKYLNA